MAQDLNDVAQRHKDIIPLVRRGEADRVPMHSSGALSHRKDLKECILSR